MPSSVYSLPKGTEQMVKPGDGFSVSGNENIRRNKIESENDHQLFDKKKQPDGLQNNKQRERRLSPAFRQLLSIKQQELSKRLRQNQEKLNQKMLQSLGTSRIDGANLVHLSSNEIACDNVNHSMIGRSQASQSFELKRDLLSSQASSVLRSRGRYGENLSYGHSDVTSDKPQTQDTLNNNLGRNSKLMRNNNMRNGDHNGRFGKLDVGDLAEKTYMGSNSLHGTGSIDSKSRFEITKRATNTLFSLDSLGSDQSSHIVNKHVGRISESENGLASKSVDSMENETRSSINNTPPGIRIGSGSFSNISIPGIAASATQTSKLHIDRTCKSAASWESGKNLQQLQRSFSSVPTILSPKANRIESDHIVGEGSLTISFTDTEEGAAAWSGGEIHIDDNSVHVTDEEDMRHRVARDFQINMSNNNYQDVKQPDINDDPPFQCSASIRKMFINDGIIDTNIDHRNQISNQMFGGKSESNEIPIKRDSDMKLLSIENRALEVTKSSIGDSNKSDFTFAPGITSASEKFNSREESKLDDTPSSSSLKLSKSKIIESQFSNCQYPSLTTTEILAGGIEFIRGESKQLEPDKISRPLQVNENSDPRASDFLNGPTMMQNRMNTNSIISPSPSMLSMRLPIIQDGEVARPDQYFDTSVNFRNSRECGTGSNPSTELLYVDQLNNMPKRLEENLPSFGNKVASSDNTTTKSSSMPSDEDTEYTHHPAIIDSKKEKNYKNIDLVSLRQGIESYNAKTNSKSQNTMHNKEKSQSKFGVDYKPGIVSSDIYNMNAREAESTEAGSKDGCSDLSRDIPVSDVEIEYKDVFRMQRLGGISIKHYLDHTAVRKWFIQKENIFIMYCMSFLAIFTMIRCGSYFISFGNGIAPTELMIYGIVVPILEWLMVSVIHLGAVKYSNYKIKSIALEHASQTVQESLIMGIQEKKPGVQVNIALFYLKNWLSQHRLYDLSNPLLAYRMNKSLKTVLWLSTITIGICGIFLARDLMADSIFGFEKSFFIGFGCFIIWNVTSLIQYYLLWKEFTKFLRLPILNICNWMSEKLVLVCSDIANYTGQCMPISLNNLSFNQPRVESAFLGRVRWIGDLDRVAFNNKDMHSAIRLIGGIAGIFRIVRYSNSKEPDGDTGEISNDTHKVIIFVDTIANMRSSIPSRIRYELKIERIHDVIWPKNAEEIPDIPQQGEILINGTLRRADIFGKNPCEYSSAGFLEKISLSEITKYRMQNSTDFIRHACLPSISWDVFGKKNMKCVLRDFPASIGAGMYAKERGYYTVVLECNVKLCDGSLTGDYDSADPTYEQGARRMIKYEKKYGIKIRGNLENILRQDVYTDVKSWDDIIYERITCNSLFSGPIERKDNCIATHQLNKKPQLFAFGLNSHEEFTKFSEYLTGYL